MMNFIRENEIDISRYLPDFVKNDENINKVLSSESKEHELQRAQLIDILNQFFINTATWGLDYWEKVFQIYSKDTESYELRRAKILAKLRAKQVSTVKFLTDLASAYFPAEATVEIQEENEKNLFRLIANYTAYNNDYVALRESIDTYKPAHLAMIIQHFLDGKGGWGYGGIVQTATVIRVYQDGADKSNNTEGF
jgi:hypothetical protein